MSPADLAALHARAIETPPPYSEADFASLLAAPGIILCGDCLGFALGRVTLDEAELLTIAVIPEARRRGVGRERLRAFEAQAAARGARRAFLEVATDNVAAQTLYRGTGWVEAGRRRHYFRNPQGDSSDALVLTRVLA